MHSEYNASDEAPCTCIDMGAAGTNGLKPGYQEPASGRRELEILRRGRPRRIAADAFGLRTVLAR